MLGGCGGKYLEAREQRVVIGQGHACGAQHHATINCKEEVGGTRCTEDTLRRVTTRIMPISMARNEKG